jgi:hypothetical protein
MTIFQIAAVLMTLTALFSCANHHVFRLPTTIGVQGLTLRGWCCTSWGGVPVK